MVMAMGVKSTPMEKTTQIWAIRELILDMAARRLCLRQFPTSQTQASINILHSSSASLNLQAIPQSSNRSSPDLLFQ
jgi:hypothetical protein